MSSSETSQAVLDAVLAAIEAVGARDALLIGSASAAISAPLEGRGLDVTVADDTVPTDRTWDAVVVAGLGSIPRDTGVLRGLHSCLGDESILVISAANMNHRDVTSALLEGSWPAAQGAAGRLFTADSLRLELEEAGFVVEMVSHVPGGSGAGDDTAAFVAVCVSHRAAAQVASARRRVAELVAERDQLRAELHEVATALRRESDERALLAVEAAGMRTALDERDATIGGLGEELDTARQRARKRRRQRDRAIAQRDALQAKVSALQGRRVVKLANKVGRITGRGR